MRADGCFLVSAEEVLTSLNIANNVAHTFLHLLPVTPNVVEHIYALNQLFIFFYCFYHLSLSMYTTGVTHSFWAKR